MTARPLYARCTELDTGNSYEGNDLEKGKSWGGSEKQWALELRWRRVADFFRGGLQLHWKHTIADSGQPCISDQ